MNILVIGNGFDLQHKLQTRYTDFLEYCSAFIKILNDKVEVTKEERDKYISFKEEFTSLFNEFVELLDNFWIKYFMAYPLKGYGWVNFESEIEKVTKNILHDRDKALDKDLLDGSFVIETMRKYDTNQCQTYEELFVYLNTELKRLNRALEIYLDYYVKKQLNEKNKMELIGHIKPDKLLSFNYTHTYFDLYGWIDYDYIHGSAEAERNIEKCDLVLGFDDHYLEKQAVLELVPFEKYYQRIVNRTGAKYLEWLSEYDEYGSIIERTIYFYGHSMSPADGDVIRALIFSPNSKIKIIFRSGHDEERAEMIKNLAVVLSPEELIKLTGAKDALIEFIEYEAS